MLRKLELPLFALLLFLAALLRFSHLSSIPGGFHGDEAVAGLEAGRILREGSIGVYSPPALGQPAGPLYLTALSVRLLGPTIFAVRAPSALWGTLTVALLFLVLRRFHERRVAFLGAGFLATLDWHIHFSRLGFPIAAWPFFCLLAAWVMVEAAGRQRRRWWALAGVAAGAGIYVYNAHILFLLALGVWTLVHLARRRAVAPATRLVWLACFVGALFVVAIPMARYVLNPANDYFSHARLISVFSSPDLGWPREGAWLLKVQFLAARYGGFWKALCWRPEMDWVDATGIVPPVPLGVLVLALLGLALTPRVRRSGLVGIALCVVLLLPLGPVVTVQGGRRALAMAPFLCFGAALGLAELWRRFEGARSRQNAAASRQQKALGVTLALALALMAQSLFDYFGRVVPAPARAWTFVQDYTEVCAYLNTLPPGTRALFFSDRWSANYEPRQFLAPRALVEDRSKEFGHFSFDPPGAMPCIFVLMGQYKVRLSELEARYPGSRVVVGPRSEDTGEPSFLALWPAKSAPRSPFAAPGSPLLRIPAPQSGL